MSNADIRGRFIWHELVTTDPEAASGFYSKVVPWRTQDSGMPSYTLWMAGKTQVGGLTALPDGAEAGTPPHWIVYIATTSVDETVAEAERLGGKVIKSATDIPNMGRFAVLADPQGATFAVYTPPGPPPEGGSDSSSEPGGFTWHELATTDHAAALEFYVELFGWEKGPTHEAPTGVYQIVNLDGAQVGGVYNLQVPSTPPHWLSYVQVTDVEKATAAAKAAGGRVLNGPMEVPGGSWITMLMDPQGGAFAVVEPPRVAAEKPAKAKRSKAAAKADVPAAASQPEESTPSEEPAAKPAPRKAVKKKGKTAAPAKKAPAKKAPAKKAPAKKTVGKKAVKKAVKKAAKKVVKKAAKKVAKKVAKKAAKKGAVRGSSAKRGKSAAKKK